MRDKEFIAYVLLYAAHSNHIETEEERDYILSKVDERTFYKVHNEIVLDNERQSMEKIQDYIRENRPSEKDKEQLIRDIKNVFFADGTVDILEKKVFLSLKKILK